MPIILKVKVKGNCVVEEVRNAEYIDDFQSIKIDHGDDVIVNPPSAQGLPFSAKSYRKAMINLMVCCSSVSADEHVITLHI